MLSLHARRVVGSRILDRLAQGEYLAHICAEPGMPSRRTIYLWRDRNPEFAAALAIAREAQAEALVGRMVRIEMDVLNGVTQPAAARITLNLIRWRVAKLARRPPMATRSNQHVTRHSAKCVRGPRDAHAKQGRGPVTRD
jgi:hypothetical protein